MFVMKKEDEIMTFLHEKVFDPILNSKNHSSKLKQGIRLTVIRMNNLSAKGMISYFWSAIAGTERSINFSDSLKSENATRFEDVLEEFRVKFDDKWLRSK
jgi:hypothetical protein